jgi:hypothetical protein
MANGAGTKPVHHKIGPNPSFAFDAASLVLSAEACALHLLRNTCTKGTIGYMIANETILELF